MYRIAMIYDSFPAWSDISCGCFYDELAPIPIHLLELFPPALRSLLVGFTYQFGNLASAIIKAVISQRFLRPPPRPRKTAWTWKDTYQL